MIYHLAAKLIGLATALAVMGAATAGLDKGAHAIVAPIIQALR